MASYLDRDRVLHWELFYQNADLLHRVGFVGEMRDSVDLDLSGCA